ncbi:MAG: fimbria/pilus outer membrane usher protein [Pseudomonadota bacterium]
MRVNGGDFGVKAFEVGLNQQDLGTEYQSFLQSSANPLTSVQRVQQLVDNNDHGPHENVVSSFESEDSKRKPIRLDQPSVPEPPTAKEEMLQDFEPAAEPSTPLTDPVTPQDAKRFSISLPVKLDGFVLGEMVADVGLDESLGVDAARLAALLEEAAAPEVVEALMRVADEANGSTVPAASASVSGLTVAYDPGMVEINLSLGLEGRGKKSLGGKSFLANRNGTFDPSRFSLGASVFARKSFTVRNPEDGARETGFDPLRISLVGQANLFGDEGVFVTGEGFYDEGGSKKLRRGNVVLFKDFEGQAVRLSFGDLPLTTAGFQAPPPIGGISVQRLFNEIQPLRNIRSTGLAQFQLERSSTVEVEVNGVVTQTLRLDPGSYDLRDLGLSDGLNEVVLIVADDAGRREIFRDSVFFSAAQLEAGITEFHAAIGAPRNNNAGSITYDGLATFTGFIRHGLSQNLTLGSSLDLNEDVQMLGAEATFSSVLGVVTTTVAASRSEQASPGFAATLNYALPSNDLPGSPRVNAVIEYTSEDFASLQNPIGRNPNHWSANVRYGTQLPMGANFQLAAGYSEGRFGRPDQRRYSAKVSAPIGRLNANLSFDSTSSAGTTNERFLFSLTAPLGGRQRARASYSNQANQTRLDWSRARAQRFDDWEARIALLRDDNSLAGAGQARYFNNRFEATLESNAITNASGSRIEEHVHAVDMAMGFGIAGGKFAFGRPLNNGSFAIVSTHKSLGDREMVIDQQSDQDSGIARNGLFGPALVPLDRAYVRREMKVDVADLPLGVDIGGGELAVVPGAKSGFVIQVGSAASNTVLGTLVKSSGEPYSLIGGTLRPLKSGKGAQEATFFTNRTGRFVAERVAPGNYAIMFGDIKLGEVEIDEGADGLVNVGEIIAAQEE